MKETDYMLLDYLSVGIHVCRHTGRQKV